MPVTSKMKRVVNKMAKRDTKIAKKFMPYLEKPGDMPLYFLKQSGRTKKWLILAEINAWGTEYDTYWNRTRFSISTTRNDFGKDSNESLHQIIVRSSHVALGNGEIYVLNNGSGVQVREFNFAQNVLADLEIQKTFLLADAEIES